MKKLITTILLSIMISMLGISVAESRPIPEVNTDVEIKFSGFEWYTDFNTTLDAATKKGLGSKEYEWCRYNFELDRYMTPHWETLVYKNNPAAGSEKSCGGYLYYCSDIPDVAGYKISELEMYFFWNPEKGPTENYSAEDAAFFYMAKYKFDVKVKDYEATYDSLVGKLKYLYGQNPYVGPDYTVWVNKEQALVGVSCTDDGVYLVYMAPGAEDRLIEVEKAMEEFELRISVGDLTGL